MPVWEGGNCVTPETRNVLQRGNVIIQIKGFRNDTTCCRFIAIRHGSFITQISEYNHGFRFTDQVTHLSHKVHAFHSGNVQTHENQRWIRCVQVSFLFAKERQRSLTVACKDEFNIRAMFSQ